MEPCTLLGGFRQDFNHGALQHGPGHLLLLVLREPSVLLTHVTRPLLDFMASVVTLEVHPVPCHSHPPPTHTHMHTLLTRCWMHPLPKGEESLGPGNPSFRCTCWSHPGPCSLTRSILVSPKHITGSKLGRGNRRGTLVMLLAWLCLPVANCPHEPRTVTSAQGQKGPTQSDFAASNSASYIRVRNLVYREGPLQVPRLFCGHGLSSVFLQALLLSHAISHPKVARLTFLWKTHSVHTLWSPTPCLFTECWLRNSSAL